MWKIMVVAGLAAWWCGSPVSGQNFAGTYTFQGEGVTLTLSLQEDQAGTLGGSLASSAGTRFQLTGAVEDGVAGGMCYDSQGGLYFEARLQGIQLILTLIEPGADNSPDYGKTRRIVFTRQPGAGSLPNPASPGPAEIEPPSPPRPPALPVPPGESFPPAPGGEERITRPGSAPPGGATGEAVSDPNWGFTFRPPAGWRVQRSAGGAVLGSDSVAGVILVLPHFAGSLEDVRAQMLRGLSEEGVQLNLAGALQPLGRDALAGDFGGTWNGQPVRARGIGPISPHGGGAYIAALTTPDKFGPQLAGAAESIAAAMVYTRVEAGELVQALSGTWVGVTANTQSQMILGPDGSYQDQSESSYSGKFTDQYGGQTGAWGAGGQNRQQGRWTARGTRQAGVLIVTTAEGEQKTYEYRVHEEKGQIYWTEYYFGGRLYGRR